MSVNTSFNVNYYYRLYNSKPRLYIICEKFMSKNIRNTVHNITGIVALISFALHAFDFETAALFFMGIVIGMTVADVMLEMG